MESFRRLIDKSSSIGVIFVDEENTEELRIVAELEQIHDELMERDLKLVQGCNSVDTLNSGRHTGPHSGPNSVLGRALQV